MKLPPESQVNIGQYLIYRTFSQIVISDAFTVWSPFCHTLQDKVKADSCPPRFVVCPKGFCLSAFPRHCHQVLALWGNVGPL